MFMVYQGQIKKIFCSYSCTQKIKRFFWFILLFLWPTSYWTQTSILVDFLFY